MKDYFLFFIIILMGISVLIMFLRYLKEIGYIFYKLIKGSDKPKEHIIDWAWENHGDDPFYGFNLISDEVGIGDVVFYNKGSWSGIYWQKVSDKDWTTSMELNILCGGSKEKFLAWAEKNNNLRNEVH